MTLSKIQRSGVAGAMAFTALGGSTPAPSNDFAMVSSAHAQVPTQRVCQPEAVVRQRMKDEGQMRLFVGKATTDEWNENVFTSNENGSKGYDLVFGNGQICIASEYRNIRVVDLNNPQNTTAIPEWAFLNYDRQAALADCRRVDGACLPHNESLQTAFNNHQYLSFMAISQKRNPDGTLSDTGVLSMTTQIGGERGSAVAFTGPRGASEPYMTMIDTTPTALAGILSQRQQVAP